MKNSKEYTLYVLGSRGSRPVHGRPFEVFGGQTSCFIVKSEKHAVVIDCGTGLFDAEAILSDCDIIDIVFTHVHYDHIIGMLDFNIFPKDARISFFGTFSTWLSYETIKDFYRHPFWPIQPNLGAVCEISNDGSSYNLADGFVLSAMKANHPDSGNIVSLTVGNTKICFMFDVEIDGNFNLNILKDCAFLVFDGMFDDSEYCQHLGWGHSTYQEGCRLASVYNCKALLITHHNPKNDDEKLLAMENKAKLLYANTRFCRAGDIFVIE
ncbi:MAG: MBL fold metallo-hydrolase [Clostridia bacterium]|nr:MBL fold metallo-hydrolase [Clostridia bacterium]